MTPILAGGFTWFGSLAHIPHEYLHIVNGGVVFFIILILSVLYKASLKSLEEEIVPDKSASFKNLVQAGIEMLCNLFGSVIHHGASKFVPMLGSVFIFIFIANLLGLIPGFLPPTENISTNLAIALTVLVYFNYAGVKKQGFVKHFGHLMGPIWWLAPLIFSIELFSVMLARPGSLTLRLFGNINGDHMVLSTISGLLPIGAPIPFMAFGIFVSFMQAFVFTILSTVYVALAVDTHH